MSEVQLIKMAGGNFRAAHQSDQDSVQKIKNGALVLANIVQPRNAKFHKKFFALLNYGFDYWEPDPVLVEGIEIEPEKNFERFRKDILILAGYRTLVVNIKNEVRYEAQSISFAKMDETEFNKVYENVFNVIWKMVMSKVRGMTPEIVENTMNQLMGFD